MFIDILKINQMSDVLIFNFRSSYVGLAGVEVNRKVLADIAVFAPNDFKSYVDIALNAIQNGENQKVTPKSRSKKCRTRSVFKRSRRS